MRNRISYFLFITIVSSIFLLSCGGGNNLTGVPEAGNLVQKYFFVAFYYNQAETTYHGVSIDNNGEINLYILDDFPVDAPEDGLLPESYLDTIFNDRKTHLNTIDNTIFQEKTSLISEAATGQLSGPFALCFDSGEYRYSAFTFDTTTGFYKEVIIYSSGTVQFINDNPAAVDLRGWLIEIAIDNQIANAGHNCDGDFTGIGLP